MTTTNNTTGNLVTGPNGARVPAIYRSNPGDSIYDGIPLVEALPSVKDKDEIAVMLKNYPDFMSSIRQYPNERRLRYLNHIFTLVHPQNRHLAEFEKIDDLLRSGYFARNIYRNGRIQLSHQPNEQQENPPGTITEQNQYILQHKQLMHNEALVRNTALLAYSGMGKTTLIKNILYCYPQVIYHSEYRKQLFPFQQLVWLHLECPFDGSHKQLMINLFREIDLALGTNYSVTHAQRTAVDTLIGVLQKVNLTLRIGIIVIDEIQRLKKVSNSASSKMLEFLVQFANTVKVPLIFVGTLEAKEILTKELQQTRRLLSEGDFIWKPPAVDSADWREFMRVLFRYQYVRQPVPLDESLIQMMHHHTKGITDLAVKLFVLTQKHLIRVAQTDSEERITPKILAEVAEKEFRELKSHLRYVVTEKSRNEYIDPDMGQIAAYEQSYHKYQKTFEDTQINEANIVLPSAAFPPLVSDTPEKTAKPKKRKRKPTRKKKSDPPSLHDNNLICDSSDYLSSPEENQLSDE